MWETVVRTLRAVPRFVLLLVIALLLLTGRGSLNLSPVQELAKSHLYFLVQWEAENLLDKWLYRGRLLLTGNSPDDQAGTALVRDYFELGERERGLVRGLEAASLSPGDYEEGRADLLKAELARTRGERGAMRNGVEEVLESELDALVSEEGLALGGPLKALGIHFPPVDFRFNPSPRVLVISPRDRIEMVQGVLLKPGITPEEMDSLERRVLEQEEMSALVAGTSGVATYPSVISSDLSLRQALEVAAHEWLHHYLFFRPLGQAYGRNPDVTSLNETLASIFGREIGGRVYGRFARSEEAAPTPPGNGTPPASEPAFDYRLEMRETRLRAEELLSEGRIEEAEAYMEERRLLFVENGHLIRKLNQAYFAFYGTYADSPASVSPIHEQLTTLRAESTSLGDLVRRVSSASSYANFLELLEAGAGVPGGETAHASPGG